MDDKLAQLLARIVELESEVASCRKAYAHACQSRELYRHLTDSSEDATWRVDREGRFTHVGNAVRTLLGYEPDALIRQPFDCVLAEPSSEAAGNIRDLWLDDQQPARTKRFEFVHRRSDGSKFPGEVLVCPLLDDHGGIVEFHGLTRDITSQRLIENAQRENEERFRKVFDHAPIAMAMANAEHQFFAVNPVFTSMLGYTAEDISSRTCMNITHPDSVETDMAEADRLVRGEISVYRTEKRYITKANEVVWGLAHVSALRSDTGKFRCFLVMINDITERKRVEEALRRSEQMQRSILKAVPWGIGVNRNRIMLWSNDQMSELFGYSHEEVRGVSIRIMYESEEAFLRAGEILAKGMARGGIACLETRLVRKDGSVFDASIVNTRIDRSDPSSDVISVITDVTERKRAEEALRDSQELYSSLVEHLPQSVFRKDRQGRFVFGNQRFCESVNLTASELVGKTDFDLFPHEMAEAYRRDDGHVMETRQTLDKVEEHLDQEGKTRFVQVLKTPLHNPSGDIGGVQGIFWDVTERKRAEEERFEIERRLLHTQKLESIGVLAGGIAHDFNNLLMAVLGNLDLAVEELAPESSARASVEEAVRATKRAADLTCQLLAYSGKGRFVLHPIDLRELVRENAHMLRASISRTVTLNLQLDQEIPPILADPGQIQQVVMNLITNASEAIGTDSGEVTISTGEMRCDAEYLMHSCVDAKPEAGSYVWLDVADTGCGMDIELQQRLFDPFFTTKSTGRGLGMSAVLGIVKRHDGALLVESERGKGTRIRVLFPTSKAGFEEPCLRTEAPCDTRDTAKRPRISGSILVVDDEEALRDVGTRMAARLGYQTLQAADGEEAVAILREHADEIVCVLLDLNMPRMDGVMAFTAFREIKPDIQVILCSGYEEGVATQRFDQRNLAGFIQKPYRFTALRTLLAKVLGEDETS